MLFRNTTEISSRPASSMGRFSFRLSVVEIFHRGNFRMWLLILAGVVVAIFVLLLLMGFYKDQLERSASARMRD